MAAITADYLCHSSRLSDATWMELKFGRRAAPGSTTDDQARLAEQITVIEDPVHGFMVRSEMGPLDTARWAAPSSSTPCVALGGSLAFGRYKSGDTAFAHFLVRGLAGIQDTLFFEWHNIGAVPSTIAPIATLVHAPGEIAQVGMALQEVSGAHAALVRDNLVSRWTDAGHPVDHPELQRLLVQATPLEAVTASGGFAPAPDQRTPAVILRMCGGQVPQGGGAQAFWHPNILIPGLQPVPREDLHIVVGGVMHTSNGNIGVWWWKHGSAPPQNPQLYLSGIPTMVFMGSTIDNPYWQGYQYGYPAGIQTLHMLGPVVRGDVVSAIAALPHGDPQPTGFIVSGRDNGDGTVTLQWTKDDRAEEYVPTIDGSEILTDGRRHPVGPGQFSTRIRKPDPGMHDYSVRVNDRVAEGHVRL